MSDKYLTEIVVHSMNGSTITIKSVESMLEVGKRIFNTDGYSTLIDIMSDNDTHTIVNLTNVCCINLRNITEGSKDE